MKWVKPMFKRPTANGMEEGYWIYWHDTETNAEKWEAITAQEYESIWEGAPHVYLHELQERFRNLARQHGLEVDTPKPRTKCLWD